MVYSWIKKIGLSNLGRNNDCSGNSLQVVNIQEKNAAVVISCMHCQYLNSDPRKALPHLSSEALFLRPRLQSYQTIHILTEHNSPPITPQ